MPTKELKLSNVRTGGEFVDMRAKTKSRSGFPKSSPRRVENRIGAYVKRRIAFLFHWRHRGITFKVYAITSGKCFRSPVLLDAALRKAADHLRRTPTRHTHYGVGFISVHEGRGENQIAIDCWINENELMHQIYVSPERKPTNFRRAPFDHNSVCVWELYLQAFERKAWLSCVLQSEVSWPRRLRCYCRQGLDVRV